MGADCSNRILVYEPHRVGRTGLRIGFAAATLLVPFWLIPMVLDPSKLPRDTPQALLIGFTGLFVFALGWNIYWFLIGSAIQVQLADGELWWETGFSSGTMQVDEIVEIRNRVGMPTLYSETNSVGLFPANGIDDFVYAVTATRPDLRPKSLGLLAWIASRNHHHNATRYARRS